MHARAYQPSHAPQAGKSLSLGAGTMKKRELYNLHIIARVDNKESDLGNVIADFPIKKSTQRSDPYWVYGDIAFMLRIFISDVRYRDGNVIDPSTRKPQRVRELGDPAKAGLFLVPVILDTARNTYMWNQSTRPIDLYNADMGSIVPLPTAKHTYLMLVDKVSMEAATVRIDDRRFLRKTEASYSHPDSPEKNRNDMTKERCANRDQCCIVSWTSLDPNCREVILRHDTYYDKVDMPSKTCVWYTSGALSSVTFNGAHFWPLAKERQWENINIEKYLKDDRVSFKSVHIKAKPNAKVEKANIQPYGLNSYQNMGIMIKEFHTWFDVHEFVFFTSRSASKPWRIIDLTPRAKSLRADHAFFPGAKLCGAVFRPSGYIDPALSDDRINPPKEAGDFGYEQGVLRWIRSMEFGGWISRKRRSRPPLGDPIAPDYIANTYQRVFHLHEPEYLNAWKRSSSF